MDWVDIQIRRGVRERSAPHDPPNALGLLTIEQKELLTLWVRKDNESRGREALLKEAGRQRIELAEVLCAWLLREGWVTRKEKLVGGTWQWDGLTWRDLVTLKSLLGVGSRNQRDEDRSRLLTDLREWASEIHADNLAQEHARLPDDLREAIATLEVESTQRVEVLEARSRWLKALHSWCLDEMQGNRRDFALHAGGHTKSISAGDWKWLEAGFDLESLGISHFTPVMWLAGSAVLHWGDRSVDLGVGRFVALTLNDLAQVTGITATVEHWWLIENRTSFERQAQALEEGILLVWMPGRPSLAWLLALENMAKKAQAPLWVSADADPAGVDMALTVGRIWEKSGLVWTPTRMGVKELHEAGQQWSLNNHDKVLLSKLLLDSSLPLPLKELCAAMASDGWKAEQEGWL